MLHVLLLILKIIGITLLVILGLILLIVGLLLFVPVRYSGDGRFKKTDDDIPDDGGLKKTDDDLPDKGGLKKTDDDVTDDVSKDGDGQDPNNKSFEIQALAKVTWLLHFISLSFNYNEDIGYRLKVLGISVLRGGNEAKTASDKKSKKDKRAKKSGKSEVPAVTEPKESEQEKDKEGKETEAKAQEAEAGEAKTQELKAKESQAEEAEAEEVKAEEAKKEENNTEETKAEEAQKEENQYTKPEGSPKEEPEINKDGQKNKEEKGKTGREEEADSKQSIVEKVKNIYNGFVELRDDKRVQRAYETVKVLLVRALKAVCPRKLGGYAKYGFEDPAVTGYITAFLAAEYSMTRDLDIEPHFEDEILEGELKFKGRIFLITIVRIGLKFLLNRDIKYSMKKFDQFKDTVRNVKKPEVD